MTDEELTAEWQRREAEAAKVPQCCFDCMDRPDLGASNPALRQMILCHTCGNKRCPKATNHELACTRSNEPGQPGSRY